MDPLITGGVEPAHLRTAEKRSSERDTERDRKRRVDPDASEEEEASLETRKHVLDDLA